MTELHLMGDSDIDGHQLATYRLESMPRFDGLIAATGRLYLTTADGKVLCLGGDDGDPLPRVTGTVAVGPGKGSR